MDQLLLVSADSHAAPPPEIIRPYLDRQCLSWYDKLVEENDIYLRIAAAAQFPEPVLDIIDKRNALRSGGVDGSWNVERRIAEMDAEGIAAEIIISGAQNSTMPFFSIINAPYPADVRLAGSRAFHRWLADCMKDSKGRLFGLADPGPALDMDATIEELKWVAAHGFRSVAVPGIIADSDLPPLHDEYYEPFWRACAELGLVLDVHAGHGYPPGRAFNFLKNSVEGHSPEEAYLDLVVRTLSPADKDNAGGDADAEENVFGLDDTPKKVLWSLMLGGVFDRYPELQFAITEVRADWIPEFLAALDERYARGDLTLRRSPSEYWHSNCWAGCSSIKHSEIRLRDEIGIERMMFGRDYPHPEGTWPNTWDWLSATCSDVPEDQFRSLLGENAIRCYGLDRDYLVGISQRIGPRLEDVRRRDALDPRLVENFDLRGGLSNSYEHIDRTKVLDLFERDAQLVRGRSS